VRRTLPAILIAAALALRPATANPILLAPSGTTLTTGQFRAEAAFSPGNDHGKYYWFAAGLMQFEASVIRFESPGGAKENLFGAQFSFLPETFITPAVSFGVDDIASQSKEGIAGYLALTKKVPIHTIAPVFREMAVTLGIGAGGIRGPFFGVDTKLPLGLFIEGEYDSHDFNAAFGWQPVEMFRVKAYNIRGESYFGAEILPISF
jgi:hypothetical protein